MQFSNGHLRVEVTTKACGIPNDQRARLQTLLAPVAESVSDFPVSDLRINVIYHPNSDAYHAEFKLQLPGQTLFADEKDPYLDSALQRGLDDLAHQAEAYSQRPDHKALEAAERRAALGRNVVLPEDGDAGPLGEAVAEGDFRTFRTILAGYEEWLRKRAGRWVQRYPEFEAQIGKGMEIADVVDGVFLMAFEGYKGRPADIPISAWLGDLVDPAVKALLENPDEELRNIRLARTALTVQPAGNA